MFFDKRFRNIVFWRKQADKPAIQREDNSIKYCDTVTTGTKDLCS
jgi:hypothetical protein